MITMREKEFELTCGFHFQDKQKLMFRLLWICFFLGLPSFICCAVEDSVIYGLQHFVRNIHIFNRLYPQEKVWLHFDNTDYFQSDTIWFAAYVTSAEDLRASDLSKVLYVELLNEGGEVVCTQRLPIEDGRCHGQIALCRELERKSCNLKRLYAFYPVNSRNRNYCIPLPSGHYEVRAYTRDMLNFGSEVCFSRVLPFFLIKMSIPHFLG